MNIVPILAQAAPAPGAVDMFGMILPMLGILAVFYFFMIRPQQQKAKEHQKMLGQAERGDTIVTNGGLIGKIVKVVDDNELLVEVGPNVQVRVLRQGIADVRAKGEPQKLKKP
ncbi:preprotein translocase subunit YajC [Aestuariivirga litoralis]|uniref:preprotein translocase subunit YajC n=1 Tax=Aestuariivirga litoralis TaxID=2650924 RepID=UPI0018C54DAF|nr:preprotein translocase subunit YajC [Aestuariivirga litoralis]MBG1231472.1 preprotein translocase subunit YajC [Aestuariivirga litoralis]